MERMFDSLFEGEQIRLGPFDPDRDAEVEALWYGDPEFLALTERDPIRLIAVPAIKKMHAEEEKDKQAFVAAIRTRGQDRLVGRATLKRIDGINDIAVTSVAIGRSEDRNHGFGTEALRLLLRYAFDEVGLFRVAADVFEYNTGAIRWLERAGFKMEVRRREAIFREGRRWDMLSFAILRQEWADQALKR